MPEESLSRSTIMLQIQSVASEVLNDGSLVLSEGTTASEVPGWDSLTHVQIVVGVESAFGIRMSSTEVAQLENVGSLIDVVQARKSKAAGA